MKTYDLLCRLFLVAALTLLMVGCAGAQKSQHSSNDGKPGWVNNPSKKYPEAMYLVGLGTGDTRKDAENSALGAISAIFQTTVNLDRELVERYKETSETDAAFQSEMLRKIRVTSDQDLRNVSFKESHFSEKDGRYYVLGVLPRLETAELYKKEIEQGNLQIEELHQKALETTDKKIRYALLSRAVDLSEVNQSLNSQLRLISRVDDAIESPISHNDLLTRRRAAINNMSVILHQQEASSPEVGEYVLQVLNELGIRVTNGNADFEIRWHLTLEKSQLGNQGQHGLDWHLNLSVADLSDGATVFSYNKANRSVSISQQQARTLVLRKVKGVVDTQFKAALEEYLRQL